MENNNAKSKVVSSRFNPMISFVVAGDEFQAIKNLSKKYGISMAHISRAFFRRGMYKSLADTFNTEDEKFIEKFLRDGSMH